MRQCAYTSQIYGPEHLTKDVYNPDIRKLLLSLVDVKTDYISMFAGMPVVAGLVHHSFVVCQGPDWHHGEQAARNHDYNIERIQQCTWRYGVTIPDN